MLGWPPAPDGRPSRRASRAAAVARKMSAESHVPAFLPRSLLADARAGARLLHGLRRAVRLPWASPRPASGSNSAWPDGTRTSSTSRTRRSSAIPRARTAGSWPTPAVKKGDLGRLVRDAGLDGARAALWHHGVYLSLDEFKSRRPVIRGTASFELHPDQLRPPHAARHASRRRADPGIEHARAGYLDTIRDCAVNRRALAALSCRRLLCRAPRVPLSPLGLRPTPRGLSRSR